MGNKIIASIVSHDNVLIDFIQHPSNEIKGEAYNIQTELSISGSEKLTFSLPLDILNEDGQLIKNSKWDLLLTTDIKVRIITGDGIKKDFYIVNNEIVHDSNQKIGNFLAISMAEYELGKIGYEKVLNEDSLLIYPKDTSGEDPNAVPIDSFEPDIHFWTNHALANTGWTYRVESNYEIDTELIEDNRQETEQSPYADDPNHPHILFVGKQQFYEKSRLLAYDNGGNEIKKDEYTIKRRIINESKSNIYNIIGSIAEKFEVFPTFEIQYNKDKIISKIVIFKNDLPDPSLFTLRYNSNISSINRVLSSDNLVTKMYVSDIENANSDFGIVSIKNAEKNFSKEGYLMNFDWFLGTADVDGIKGKPLLNEFLEWTRTDINGDSKTIVGAKNIIKDYSEVTRGYNLKIIEIQETINKLESDISNLTEEYNYEESSYDAALTCRNQEINAMALIPDMDIIKEDMLFAYFKNNKWLLNMPVDGILDTSIIVRYDDDSASINIHVTKRDPIVAYCVKELELIGVDESKANKGVLRVKASYIQKTKSFLNELVRHYQFIMNKSSQRMLIIGKPKEMGGSGILADKEQRAINNRAILTDSKLAKEKLIGNFNSIMNPYIREGYWEDTSYASYIKQENDLVNIIPNLELAKNTSGEPAWTSATDSARDVFNLPNIVIGEYNNSAVYLYDVIDFESIEVFWKQDPLSSSIDDYMQYDFGTYVLAQSQARQILDGSVSDTYQKGIYIWFLKDKFDPLSTYLKGTDIWIRFKLLGNDTYFDQDSVIGLHYRKLTRLNKETPTMDVDKNYMSICYIDAYANVENTNIVLPTVNMAYEGLLYNLTTKAFEPHTYNLTYGYNYSNQKEVKNSKIIVKITLSVDKTLTQLLFPKAGAFSGSYVIKYQTDQTEDYYFNDAQEKLIQSCVPNVDYQIGTIKLDEYSKYIDGPDSDLIELKINKPIIGDRIYIVDSELNMENVVGSITNITTNYNNPTTNSFTVSNYKDKFKDLFQRISAATINTENNAAYYEKATETVNNKGQIPLDIIRETILNNDFILSKTQDNNVSWGEKGIILTNKRLNENGVYGQVRLTSGGIFLANDMDENENYIWVTGITPDYINADLLKAGSINTKQIKIYNDNYQRFMWDETGIHAYKELLDATGKIIGTDFDSFVTYNQDGLLFKRRNEKGEIQTDLQLGWEGLKIGAQDGVFSLTSGDGIKIYRPLEGINIPTVHMGTWEELGKSLYGIRGLNSDGSTNFSLTQNGLYLDFKAKIDNDLIGINNNLEGLPSPNLVRNSAMLKMIKYQNEEGKIYSIPDFWMKEVKRSYVEGPVLPENPTVGEYWYCTEPYGQYEKGIIYRYDSITNETNSSFAWVKTGYTRKYLQTLANLLKYTTQESNEESKLLTESNSFISLVMSDGDNDENSHIFNATSTIDYKQSADFVTMHLKLTAKELNAGVAYIVLAFLDKSMEEIGVEAISSLYEPTILVTPDEYNELGEVVITVPNFKKGKIEEGGSFHECYASLVPPTDLTKKWLHVELKMIGGAPTLAGISLKKYNGSTWIEILDRKSCYITNDIPELAIPKTMIFAYREMFKSYYPSGSLYNDSLKIKSIYGLISMYGGLHVVSDTYLNDYIDIVPNIPANPDASYRNIYWAKKNDYVYRAKLIYEANGKPVGTGLWQSTGITTDWMLTHPLPAAYQAFGLFFGIPPHGKMTISDLKIEYSSAPTRWVPYKDEIYGKNVKIDELGIQVTAGNNIMLIDEDEITSLYAPDNQPNNHQEVFKIKGNETSFEKILVRNTININDYTVRQTVFDDEEVLIFV